LHFGYYYDILEIIYLKWGYDMLSLYLAMVDTDEDRSFVEMLYTKYQRDMYGVAISIFHNKSDAEDAVHEAFLRIIENLDKIKLISADKLRYYLVIISRNTSLNILKKRNNKNEPVREDLDNIEDPERIEDIIDAKFGAAKIKGYIHKLKETDFEVIFMWLILELSSAEIASILNISLGAARQRLHKAKKNFRAIIESENNDDQ
jgi:RNA polymerase sigma-70 factor (ECF subfamily)